MILEVFWFTFFWFLAGLCAVRCGAIFDAADGNIPASGCAYGVVSIVSVYVTGSISWDGVVCPFGAFVDRVIPESGTIHTWTVFVVCVAALAAYLYAIYMTGRGLRAVRRLWANRRRAEGDLRHA